MAYINVSHSTTKNSMNNYTITVTLGTSSSAVWNGYGVRVWANIGGSWYNLGTTTISSGVPATRSYSKSFTISSDTSVYGYAACSYCEDGLHNENPGDWTAQSSATTVYYENPAVAPGTPGKPSVSGHYEVGSSITISWGAVSGTAPIKYYVQYNQWNRDTNSWMGWGNVAEGQGVTSTSVTQKISSVGDDRWCVRYRVYASNAGGSSSWSPDSDDIYHYGVRIYKDGGWKWTKVMIYKNGKWNHAILECNKDGWQTTM